MKRVLLIGPTPPPSGGIASHLDDLGRAAAELGFETRRLGLPAKRVATQGAWRSGVRLARGMLWAQAHRAIVHLHTNGHNPGSWRLIACVTAVTSHRRLLLTIHSGLAPEFILSQAAQCRRALRPYRAIVGVSRTIVDALLAAGLEGDRLRLVPAFSAAALPLPLQPAGWQAIARVARPLLVAIVGHGAEYGTEALALGFAEIARRLPEAHLVILGAGARDPRSYVQLCALDISHRIHRMGDLSRPEALGALATADLLIRPSLTDGDALSIREALALGVRVVASDAVPRPPGVHTFPAGDPAALAAAACTALLTPPWAPQTDAFFRPLFELYRELPGEGAH